MSWNSIVGQQKVKEILRTIVKRRRLAHAYLFSGPEGAGKDATAIELAKVLNCELQGIEACGKCSSCVKFEKLQHPNVNLVFALPVGKNEKYGDSPIARLSDEDIALIRQELQLKAANPYHSISLPRANTIKINSIRDIRKESSLSAFGKGMKVFVIIDAERLSEESSNAFLKTLEEPHENTILILTTSQPERLLPTIVSRCQHLRFEYLTTEEISSALRSHSRVESSNAELIAHMSRGSFSRALELTASSVEDYYAEVTEFLRTALYKSHQELLEEIDRLLSEYEKPDIEEFLVLLQSWFHAAMLLKEKNVQIVSTGDGEVIRKFVEHHGTVEYSRLFDITDRAISLLNKNVYIPLILLNLAIDLRNNIVASPVRR